MERQTVSKVIYEEEGNWGKDPIPENLIAAIEWLQAKLDSLPEDMRDDARLEIYACPSWENSAVLQITIEGRRPETDEEMAARLRLEAAKQEDARRRQEANERAAYEALKRKYGG